MAVEPKCRAFADGREYLPSWRVAGNTGEGKERRNGPGQRILSVITLLGDSIEVGMICPDHIALIVGAPDEDRSGRERITQRGQFGFLGLVAQCIDEHPLTFGRKVSHGQPCELAEPLGPHAKIATRVPQRKLTTLRERAHFRVESPEALGKVTGQARPFRPRARDGA